MFIGMFLSGRTSESTQLLCTKAKALSSIIPSIFAFRKSWCIIFSVILCRRIRLRGVVQKAKERFTESYDAIPKIGIGLLRDYLNEIATLHMVDEVVRNCMEFLLLLG